MKTYIVYDSFGNELGYIKAGSHNAAEAKARKKFANTVPRPELISVAYTEL
jgi:hypothetical protein